MRKIIAAEFMTIDGVIQSSPEDGFKYEGWFFGYTDEEAGAVITGSRVRTGSDSDWVLSPRIPSNVE
ncbi:MAG: hypothetical protein ACT4O9_13965 [Blastocatellia bacterium]